LLTLSAPTHPSILSPVGEWRSQIPTSRGKSWKKKNKKKRRRESDESEEEEAQVVPPPPPNVFAAVTVGLNTTSRAIEAQRPDSSSSTSVATVARPRPRPRPLVAVFLTHPTTALEYAHLPLLAERASPKVRLVPLHSGAEKRLAAALGLARVGMVGIREDDAMVVLLSCLDEVPNVEVPYLDQVSRGDWLGTKIDTHMPGNEAG
jgi:ribonuclease P/MRP protein subunit POP3